jgi:hypothetical protein
MRILQHFKTAEEAEAVGKTLEDRGIATFVLGKNEEWAGGPMSGPAGAALCVIVDRQYDDAVRLLDDPDYEVQVTLSPDEISHIRSSLQPASTVRAMLPVLVRLLVLVGIIALAVKLLLTFYDAG